MFTEEQAEEFSFDVLDATKIVPEELVPVTPVGRMVLNRNPDNFFAETEQVAFCTAHVVPGIDFTNDPLLAGRIHSYLDTQLSRLGGPNFHEIPINAPVVEVHNNQRDGLHRQTCIAAASPMSRTRSAAAARSRRVRRGLHVVPRADRGRQGSRQAAEVRRALHAGRAVLEQPDPGRAGAHRAGVPVRADARAGSRDP